jgi:hypothetical protein
MRFLSELFPLLCTIQAFPQNLQLLYDMRHAIDPELNPKNYPSLSFEYFKSADTTGSGLFMLKLQNDLKGDNYNIGQSFVQVTRSIRYWKPKFYLTFNYSGGLGVFRGWEIPPTTHGFQISNSYAAGLTYTYVRKGAWMSSSLYFRYNAFEKPSYDPQLSIYFGDGFFDYKLVVTGGIVLWTQNRDQGIESTRGLRGKRFAFFADPQIWYRFYKGMSAGTKINLYYHLLSEQNTVKIYPSVGLKFQL